MDILAHALYGVTCCSRSGLAGGSTGLPGIPWYRDPSVGWALLFGLLPDIVSMWIPFALHYGAGTSENFFVHYGGNWLEVYRWMHSLVPALMAAGLIRLLYKPLFIPSLAWVVHILCDAVSHGEGKFQTTLFYPFSSWGIRGIPFWRHPEFILGYWAVLAGMITGIIVWRYRKRQRTAQTQPPATLAPHE